MTLINFSGFLIAKPLCEKLEKFKQLTILFNFLIFWASLSLRASLSRSLFYSLTFVLKPSPFLSLNFPIHPLKKGTPSRCRKDFSYSCVYNGLVLAL